MQQQYTIMKTRNRSARRILLRHNQINNFYWICILLVFSTIEITFANVDHSTLAKHVINKEPHSNQPVQIEILDSNLKIKHFPANCFYSRRSTVISSSSSFDSIEHFRIKGSKLFGNFIVQLLDYSLVDHSKRTNFNSGDQFAQFDDDDTRQNTDADEDESLSKFVGDSFTAYGFIKNYPTNSSIYLNGQYDGCGRVRLNAFLMINDTVYYLRPSTSETPNYNEAENRHLISVESHLTESKQLNHFLTSENLFFDNFSESTNRHHYQRNKRETNTNSRTNCALKIIVDYSFYSRMDFSSSKTILFIEYYTFVANRVFQNTVFTRSGFRNHTENYDTEIFENYGIILCEIKIHKTLDDNVGYNLIKEWNYIEIAKLLKQSLTDSIDFCALYLFTENKIHNMSGFSAIGKIFTNYNIGVISFNGFNLYNVASIFTFVHEIGHNFDSDHDPDDPDCMPTNGGVFLMSQKLFQELGPNNFLFSPCSIRSMYFKIVSNVDHFTDWCIKSCGNMIVENGEECDEGERERLDGCCQPDCRFKPNATCSPYHSGCCDEQCQVKGSGEACTPSDELTCRQESLCDGQSDQCPERPMIADGSQCIPQPNVTGVCLGGFCRYKCPAKHHVCTCSNEFVCSFCCEFNNSLSTADTESFETNDSNSTGGCVPHFNLADQTMVSNGTQLGRCKSGQFVPIEIPPPSLPSTEPPSIPKDLSDRGKVFGIPIFIIVLVVLFLLGLIAVYALYRWANSRHSGIYHTESIRRKLLPDDDKNNES